MNVMLVTILGFLAMTGVSAQASEAYPTRTITMIVPFSAGGPIDAMARLLAARISENVGQAVIVENRVGAGGLVGINAAAKAAPDGHTILYTPNTLAVSQAIYKTLAFDAEKDFAPISETLSFSFVLVARPGLNVTTLPAFLALAKAKPGKLNFGTAGPADILQMGMEMLKIQSGIDVVAIPYRGQAPILSALLGGEIDAAFLSPQIALAPIQDGQLIALALTGTNRSPLFPRVPTIAESGVPGYDLTGWQGALVPAATPREIVARLNAEIVRAIKLPDVGRLVATSGNEAVGGTSDDFRTLISADVARFKKLVRDAQIPKQD